MNSLMWGLEKPGLVETESRLVIARGWEVGGMSDGVKGYVLLVIR